MRFTQWNKRSLMAVSLPQSLAGGAALLLLLGGTWAHGADPPATLSDQVTFEKQMHPILKQYCVSCHSGQKPAGGIMLDAASNVLAIQRDQATWRKVATQLHGRSMPPATAPQPSEEQRGGLLVWLNHTLDSAGDAVIAKNPGRVLIHRLNRMEYNNTVRDLLGVTSNPADSFPADGGGGAGFDNNADTLFIPPILMERYLQAAGKMLAEARPERLFFVKPGNRLTPRAAARQIVARFAMRGFRRPVDAGEVDRLMRLYDGSIARKESHAEAVKLALKAVLVSPRFLFRVESNRDAPNTRALGDYDLANRLSYFLWASMPDDTLFQLAAGHRLKNPVVLEREVRRMLQSPKSQAFAESFAGQWLHVRDLYTTAKPDPGRYPDFTPALRDAMFQEPIELVHNVLSQNASLITLLDADYTYLNADLARHYGIEGVQGAEMRRVALTDRRRGGVVTTAAVLTVTSYALRTSPVVRGKWVLEAILGTPPAPPPPNAGGLPADDAPTAGLTFRQRLEKHRARPECAGCHSRMDPIGFGLENFDAVGRWRQEVAGIPVDSSGVLVNGDKFSGPAELKQRLLTDKAGFVRNLTEKMLGYALGRGLEPYDLPAVRKISAAVEKDGYRSGTLVRSIVESYPFQYRNDADSTGLAPIRAADRR